MTFLFFVAFGLAIYFYVKLRRSEKTASQRGDEISGLTKRVSGLQGEVDSLARFRTVLDAEQRAREIVAEAEHILEVARTDATEIGRQAGQDAKARRDQAESRVAQAEQKVLMAHQEAERIVAAARQRAEEIAGSAFAARERAEEFEKAAKAMKNIIDGYGDRYIIPSYSLLDNLADDYGYTEAGNELKVARDRSRTMVKLEKAATCDYVEDHRRSTAVRFVVDAFNGKVDSILSRVKTDNYGTLEQQIKDAFSLVNLNGMAFRSARILEPYLTARLEELRLAVVVQEIRERDREEQRRIKEQIREEEKARREFERAIRDAEKEEDMLRKAMEKIQQSVDKASAEQKVKFEAQLAELQGRLLAAEEKNQRALSMAQQTRSGHVYIISNIGSFGDEVFKIGMTRRLEPLDRVRELGDASVPFEFDVHAMIFSEDAPTLERDLHKHFFRMQVNKVNPRKEFFKVPLNDIQAAVTGRGLEVQWTIMAAARQYRESMAIEQELQSNPDARQEWLQKQMDVSLEPLSDEVEENL
jgi:hypothetical protein